MDRPTMDTKRRPVRKPALEAEPVAEQPYMRLTAAYQIGPSVDALMADRLRNFLNQRGLKEITDGRYTVSYLLQVGMTAADVRATPSTLTVIAETHELLGPGDDLIKRVYSLYGKG